MWISLSFLVTWIENQYKSLKRYCLLNFCEFYEKFMRVKIFPHNGTKEEYFLYFLSFLYFFICLFPFFLFSFIKNSRKSRKIRFRFSQKRNFQYRKLNHENYFLWEYSKEKCWMKKRFWGSKSSQILAHSFLLIQIWNRKIIS